MPLPDDFRWTGDDEHMTLKLGDQVVATVTALDNGYARICFHPDAPIRLRYDFVAGMARGTARVEAWATRWEERLRDEAARPRARSSHGPTGA